VDGATPLADVTRAGHRRVSRFGKLRNHRRL